MPKRLPLGLQALHFFLSQLRYERVGVARDDLRLAELVLETAEQTHLRDGRFDACLLAS
jgi:hypothetical protein